MAFNSRKDGMDKTGDGPGAALHKRFTQEGMTFAAPSADAWESRDPARFGLESGLAAFLLQLEDEGAAEIRGSDVFLPWGSVFGVQESREHAESFALFGLPPVEKWTPALASQGALTDSTFSIHIAGWKTPDDRRPSGNVLVEGALIKAEGRRALLPRSAWEVTVAVFAFCRARASDGGNADSNKRGWATVRTKAVAAGANMTSFLTETIVLEPERLDIRLRKATVGGIALVEVSPGFKGEPTRWIEIFDKFSKVQECYQIPAENGLTHVIISPEVGTVLHEIKRMPGRRVIGDRAEAFLRNPFAALGPDATSVVDPAQFEKARDEAGISFTRFTARVVRDEAGYPVETGLRVEEMAAGKASAEILIFNEVDSLSTFLEKLDVRIAAGSQFCHWKSFDLEILGDTPAQAEMLRVALTDMQRPQRVTASDVLNLSLYSDRVERFGVEKYYYSRFIARKSDDSGWVPENVEFGILYMPKGGGETVPVRLGSDNMASFKQALARAKDEHRETFQFPGCPEPIRVDWGEETLGTFGKADAAIRNKTFEPAKRMGLVLKPNINSLDYAVRRGALTSPKGELSPPPRSLRAGMSLKSHQQVGLTWLLHLWSKSPDECSGALLADDMGLGKTLQLLAFMACALEREPGVPPFLVIAPVSLLENWEEEIERFFEPGTFKILTLYGKTLASKRLPKSAIAPELSDEGVTNLLRRDWLGGANLVLTTYETLRDLEFSLASQKWSVMVCDEAQKIKNPNAMVTRAAKKQNARFKIACTGTPVENTLTDIWCLFDFIQAGLLGALKDFGERYRKPIESETEEEKARVKELTDLIDPQTLRRMKAEVAKDLPTKTEEPTKLEEPNPTPCDRCRQLRLSDRQRLLYAQAVQRFRSRTDGAGIASHLGLLLSLRRICANPTHLGSLASDATPISEIERDSPKMAWLLKALLVIRDRGEKAIVFCELRDVQRILQRAVAERFGFVPDIINGDTSALSTSANSRQKRLKAFQERRGFGVIVLSPLAVGFGVNIQAANHVIHFTRTWNPAKEDQATDRAYRIGQTREVFVYYPVVGADDFTTFDAKLDKLLEWKKCLATTMLNGTGDVRPSEFVDLQAPDGGKAFGDKDITPDDLDSLDPDAFEAFCALLWSKMGYRQTRRTPKSGDGGVDVVAISGKNGVLIQCKSSLVTGREIDWGAVKDVVAGKAGYQARHANVNFSLVAATNKRFNGTAKAQAALNHVELIDFDGLAKKLKENPVKWGELESYLFAGWE